MRFCTFKIDIFGCYTMSLYCPIVVDCGRVFAGPRGIELLHSGRSTATTHQ